MGTLRKLQTEIDKTLKKVNEGLEEFDETFDQVGYPACSFWFLFQEILQGNHACPLLNHGCQFRLFTHTLP